MIEQFTDGKCDTFSAYNFLGMKKDYREYSSIRDILKILNINPKFILLTNNPDKVDAMNLAIDSVGVESMSQSMLPRPCLRKAQLVRMQREHLIALPRILEAKK